MIRDREHECMARRARAAPGENAWPSRSKRVYERVPFYKDLFDTNGNRPGQVTGPPRPSQPAVHQETNLREQYPFGLFATPLKEVVRIHASSGTTGKPTTVGYNPERHQHVWAEVMARCLAGVGTQR